MQMFVVCTLMIIFVLFLVVYSDHLLLSASVFDVCCGHALEVMYRYPSMLDFLGFVARIDFSAGTFFSCQKQNVVVAVAVDFSELWNS